MSFVPCKRPKWQMDHPEGIACPIPPKRFSFVFWQEWQAIALSWGGGGQKKIGKDKRESRKFQIKPGQKSKLSLIFILYPNKQKWKTTTIGLISKNQQQLCTCSTLFVHFFVVVLHDYNMKLPETSLLNVLWRKFCVCSCSLIFHCCLFLTMWPLAFLIFSPRAVKY